MKKVFVDFQMQSTGNEDFGYPEVSLELMPKESSLGGNILMVFIGSIGWSVDSIIHYVLTFFKKLFYFQ